MHDFKGFQLVIISVLLFDLGGELHVTQGLIMFFWRHCFNTDIFKMVGLAAACEDIHTLFCEAGRIFIHSDRLELLHCIA